MLPILNRAARTRHRPFPGRGPDRSVEPWRSISRSFDGAQGPALRLVPCARGAGSVVAVPRGRRSSESAGSTDMNLAMMTGMDDRRRRLAAYDEQLRTDAET